MDSMGADPEMFEGAVWVLTPDSDVPDDTFATVASVISQVSVRRRSSPFRPSTMTASWRW